MDLTSREVHEKQFHESWRGYNQGEVDDFLDRVAESLDRLQRENDDLRIRNSELDQSAAASRDTEEMLKKTLVTAQRAAEEAIANAKAKAEEIVSQAEERVRTAESNTRERIGTLEQESRQRVMSAETESRRKTSELEREVAQKKREYDEKMERMRSFETDTKRRLKAFLEQQMKALEALTESQQPSFSRPAARPGTLQTGPPAATGGRPVQAQPPTQSGGATPAPGSAGAAPARESGAEAGTRRVVQPEPGAGSGQPEGGPEWSTEHEEARSGPADHSGEPDRDEAAPADEDSSTRRVRDLFFRPGG